MTLSIAVAGKGGIGKTTLCALLVRSLRDLGQAPILAVDADPNSTLADALGIEPGKALAEIREQGAAPEGSPASGIGRVRAVGDELQRAIAEADGFDLITMGRPEGPRCYCAVNNLLRTSLDGLARNYPTVLVDNEAGMEHLSRRTTNDVDFLIAVLNPTLPSCRAAERIVALAKELPIRIGRVLLLVNRVGPQGIPEAVLGPLGALRVERLPDIPEDDAVEQAGAVGRSVFSLPADNPALLAAKEVASLLRSRRWQAATGASAKP